MSILSRFRRPTPPVAFEPRTDDFAEMSALYPPAVLPPPCSVAEPEDPMAALVAALDAVPTAGYVPPSWTYSEAEQNAECVVACDLAERIADGMSPLAAAQAKFGGSHA